MDGWENQQAHLTLYHQTLSTYGSLQKEPFEGMLSLPTERGPLQLQDLPCISRADLRNLARFVRILHRRDVAVEIVGIH